MSVTTENVSHKTRSLPAATPPQQERRNLGESFMLWLLFSTMIMLAVALLGDLLRGLFR